jgi:hypothetical protein
VIVLDGGDVAVPGIVDHDIDTAEFLEASLHHSQRGVVVGDVEVQRQHATAGLRDEVVQQLRLASRGDHRGARCESRLNHCAPEAARRAGDEPYSRHAHSFRT